MVTDIIDPETPGNPARRVLPPRDTRSLLKHTDTVTIIFPLVDEVQRYLDQILIEDEDSSEQASDHNENERDSEDEPNDENEPSRDNNMDSRNDEVEEGDFTAGIIELLDRSEMLFQYDHGYSTMVLRVTETVVVKLIRESDNTTEYSNLRYLQDHAPGIPAPRPCGLLKIGHYFLMFSSFIPGDDLDKVWPRLNVQQKQDLSTQLDSIFSELRSISLPPDMPLGGTGGEGCKDIRRNIRISAKPIMNSKEFEEFIFTSSRPLSPIYLRFIKSLIPSDSLEMKCVFTHSDLRPANIRAIEQEDGRWKISGIIDWEFSGFYPEYWEALKITNTLSVIEDCDWYQYLPKSLSPEHHRCRWLLDRLWDQFVAWD
jgi:hypothetical protein